MQKKIMVLGSGELAKEFIIAAKRLGQYVIAADSYPDAPGMQVADSCEVINMLDGSALDAIVEKHKPDIIIPEIEAIRTERLYDYEQNGIKVIPSAKAVNYTMNRKAIRDLAANELGLKTAKFQYAVTKEELYQAADEIGFPCVIKPLMSSSGKGQSVVRNKESLSDAWEYGINKSRGDIIELIVEEFIEFDLEITLLTVTQKNGKTLFAPPIGHVQKSGDYRESWQPADLPEKCLREAEAMADTVTKALGGEGIWGIEFFIGKDNSVYFSELSPRPHDTGMVTLAGTLNLNEFELHLRASLNFPINEIKLERKGASAVILSDIEEQKAPSYFGIEDALKFKNTDVKIFRKPCTKKNRRMGVIVTYGENGEDVSLLRERAKNAAACVTVK